MPFWKKWIRDSSFRPNLSLGGSPRTYTPLPPELILQILSLYVNELHIARRKLLYPINGGSTWQSDVEQMSKELANVNETRFHLCRVACLSRSWSSICTPLLYSHAILATPRQLRLFKRTVSHSPSLATIVKTVLVLPVRRAFCVHCTILINPILTHARTSSRNLNGALPQKMLPWC